MTPDTIQIFSPGFLQLLIKVFVLIVLLLYGIFAAVLMRQVQIMNRVVTLVTFSPILSIIAFTHFLASIALFVVALLSL